VSVWNVKAIIMPKDGVNDPQGEAIKGGLASLQFEGILNVRAGKQIVVTVEAESEEEAVASVSRMCDQLLANPVIETYTVSAEPAQVGTMGAAT
jgi:phosphoribosylformylglycinamidine synthase PurS subunit